MYYSTTIGIDAHKHTNSLCAINATTGEVRRTKVSAEPQQTISWITKQHFSGPVQAVYESGPTGFGLARALIAAHISCIVAAVSKLPRRGDKLKNDKRDAEWLARQLMAGSVHKVWIPTPEQEALRNLSRLREQAAASLRHAKQRLTSYMLLLGLTYTEHKRWTKAFLAWAQTVQCDQKIDTYNFREKIGEVIRRQERLLAIEEMIQTTIEADPQLKAQVQKYRSLHGIGTVIAFSLIFETGDITRFRGGAAFASYLGLTPSENSTGEHIRQGAITKCGNVHLRRLLVEAAHAYDKKGGIHFGKDSPSDPRICTLALKCFTRLKRQHDYLTKRGKQKNKVTIAIARELAKWIYQLSLI